MSNPIVIPVSDELQQEADALIERIPLEKMSFGEPAENQPIDSEKLGLIVEELVRLEANSGLSGIARAFNVSVGQVQAIYNAIMKKRGVL